MRQIIKMSILMIAFLAISPSCVVAQPTHDATEQMVQKAELSDAKLPIADKQLAFRDSTIDVVANDPFPTDQGIPGIVSWFLTNWNRLLGNLAGILLLLEAIVSIFPTSSNWSVFQRFRELLDRLKLFQNRRSGGGRFVATTEVKDR